MSKYFIDTEFLEGPQDKTILGFKYGITKPTIDLISIGIVAEDGREYYAISKDFNLKEAWNRWQVPHEDVYTGGREYWIRENVLYPIFKELYNKSIDDKEYVKSHFYSVGGPFSYSHMKSLIKWYGKTNNQIAKEIKNFVYLENKDFGGQVVNRVGFIPNKYPNPDFYAYYADYDWVAFCWLFGRMIDLPKGFPMYCRDLKQILDETIEVMHPRFFQKHYLDTGSGWSPNFNEKLDFLKSDAKYPKQTNEHNALEDARWNYELFKFLESL